MVNDGWFVTAQGAIAMTCTLPPREAEEHFGILVWTFAVLMHPEFILEAPIEVTCFDFNSGQPNIVVGGCCNGQIVMWDYSRVRPQYDDDFNALSQNRRTVSVTPACSLSIDVHLLDSSAIPVVAWLYLLNPVQVIMCSTTTQRKLLVACRR